MLEYWKKSVLEEPIFFLGGEGFFFGVLMGHKVARTFLSAAGTRVARTFLSALNKILRKAVSRGIPLATALQNRTLPYFT
jgi:hypothetical protein